MWCPVVVVVVVMYCRVCVGDKPLGKGDSAGAPVVSGGGGEGGEGGWWLRVLIDCGEGFVRDGRGSEGREGSVGR